MSSKKKSFTDKEFQSLNQAEKSFIIEQLREKYTRRSSSMVTPHADEIKKNERSRSRLQTRETDRDSRGSESPKLSGKKPSFRDVVLRAAQHKPFRENLDINAQRRLSGLGHDARLHRFRQMASRWKAKSKKVADIAEVPQETEYEIVIPEKPRFCATLSTEAQYAIFKGYEDALVHKISTSLPSSKDGVSIKRAPSAKAEKRGSEEKISPFTILENKPTIALVSSLKEPEKYFLENNERAWGEEDHDRRYMTAQFEKAMNLLDEITHNSYVEQSTGAEHESGLECEVTLERNIKQYNAWSKQWTKHFEFPC